jgi:hypothetical protein
MSNFSRLPPYCAARHVSTGIPIIIFVGENGYHEFESEVDVDKFNQENDVTETQVKAMIYGSMFGWDVPGADPQYYNKH